MRIKFLDACIYSLASINNLQLVALESNFSVQVQQLIKMHLMWLHYAEYQNPIIEHIDTM